MTQKRDHQYHSFTQHQEAWNANCRVPLWYLIVNLTCQTRRSPWLSMTLWRWTTEHFPLVPKPTILPHQWVLFTGIHELTDNVVHVRLQHVPLVPKPIVQPYQCVLFAGILELTDNDNVVHIRLQSALNSSRSRQQPARKANKAGEAIYARSWFS